MMFLKTIVAVTGLTLLAFAGGQVVTQEKSVVVHTSNNGDSKLRMEMLVADGDHQMTMDINGETIHPDINGMEVGDVRAFTTDSGSEITIERKDEHTYTLNAGDGEIQFISGGDHDGEHGQNVFIAHGDSDHDFVWSARGMDDVVTISGLNDLDEAARALIIQALRDAGVEKEVRFADVQIHTFHDGHVKKMKIGDGSHHKLLREVLQKGDDDQNGKVIVIKKQ